MITHLPSSKNRTCGFHHYPAQAYFIKKVNNCIDQIKEVEYYIRVQTYKYSKGFFNNRFSKYSSYSLS